MNAAEFHTGFALVTKIMAKMICGPANMVRARGKIARFMISFQYTAVKFHWLQRIHFFGSPLREPRIGDLGMRQASPGEIIVTLARGRGVGVMMERERG